MMGDARVYLLAKENEPGQRKKRDSCRKRDELYSMRAGSWL